MFNADDFVAAMSPPSIIVNKVTYTGRLLSQKQFLEYRTEFNDWATGEAFAKPDANPEAFLRDILVKFGFDTAAQDAILSLPPVACEAAFTDFFVSHREQSPAKTAPVSEQQVAQ